MHDVQGCGVRGWVGRMLMPAMLNAQDDCIFLIVNEAELFFFLV